MSHIDVKSQWFLRFLLVSALSLGWIRPRKPLWIGGQVSTLGLLSRSMPPIKMVQSTTKLEPSTKWRSFLMPWTNASWPSSIPNIPSKKPKILNKVWKPKTSTMKLFWQTQNLCYPFQNPVFFSALSGWNLLGKKWKKHDFIHCSPFHRPTLKFPKIVGFHHSATITLSPYHHQIGEFPEKKSNDSNMRTSFWENISFVCITWRCCFFLGGVMLEANVFFRWQAWDLSMFLLLGYITFQEPGVGLREGEGDLKVSGKVVMWCNRHDFLIYMYIYTNTNMYIYIYI